MKNNLLYKLLAVLILASLALSACGGAATEVPATDAPAVTEAPAVVTEAPVATEAPATEAPKPSGKLLIWVQKSNMEAWQNTVLPAFQEMYPDIEIEFVNSSPQEVAEKAGLCIQAGSGCPDLFVSDTLPGSALVDLGGLMDLTDLVSPYIAEMSVSSLAACTKDGKIYCATWDVSPVGTFYRRDVFEAAGLASDPESVNAAIATYDDLLATCNTIKEKTGLPCFSLNKANSDGQLYDYMLSQQGLGYFNDKGEITINSAENIATLEKLKLFWDAGVVSDTQQWTDPWYAEFSNPVDNKEAPPTALIIIPVWMGSLFKTWLAIDAVGNWGVAEMPAFTTGGSRSATTRGSSYFIPETSANPEAAKALIQFLNFDPANNAAIFAAGGTFPAYASAYADPIFEQEDPYFGGQKVNAFFADVAKNSPADYLLHPYAKTVAGKVQIAIQKFAMGEMSAADALQEAAEGAALETGLSIAE